jgi:hypothetical protein
MAAGARKFKEQTFKDAITLLETSIAFRSDLDYNTLPITFPGLAKKRLVQIPWLEENYGMTNKFYKNSMTVKESTDLSKEAKEKQQLLLALSAAVPIYLPAR